MFWLEGEMAKKTLFTTSQLEAIKQDKPRQIEGQCRIWPQWPRAIKGSSSSLRHCWQISAHSLTTPAHLIRWWGWESSAQCWAHSICSINVPASGCQWRQTFQFANPHCCQVCQANVGCNRFCTLRAFPELKRKEFTNEEGPRQEEEDERATSTFIPNGEIIAQKWHKLPQVEKTDIVL